MSESEPVVPAGSSKAKTIAAVVVVLAFVAGLLIGIVGDRVWMFRVRDRFFGRMHGNMTAFIVGRLDRELKLNPQQKIEVTHIIDTHRQHIEAITATVRPQIRRELDESNADIEKVLTPDQRLKFDKLKMRILPRRDRMRGFAPGSMPMHPPFREPGTPGPVPPSTQPPAATSPRP